MKTVFEHIEYVKGKPHHVRKRVAFTAAACGTALVGLVWLASSLSTGAFAIQGSNFADSTAQGSVITTDKPASTQGLAGAGAAGVFDTSEDVPAHIEIVNTTPAPANKKQAEQTTLPF